VLIVADCGKYGRGKPLMTGIIAAQQGANRLN
jgi:hypothetical protein